MAAPALVRTKKFLCALACGVPVLSTNFIHNCITAGEVSDYKKLLLKDTINEKRFGVKIHEAVNRAKSHKRHLLHGVNIYCLENIEKGSDTFKSIVESNGGMFYIYKGRGGSVIKPGKLSDDEEVEPVYLLSGTTPAEKKLWPRFEQMATEGNMEPRIVVPEWLLDTAMRQEYKWDDKYLGSKQ
jgi:hypothetical protein